MPSESKSWSCCYCGKSYTQYEDAEACEQMHVHPLGTLKYCHNYGDQIPPTMTMDFDHGIIIKYKNPEVVDYGDIPTCATCGYKHLYSEGHHI